MFIQINNDPFVVVSMDQIVAIEIETNFSNEKVYSCLTTAGIWLDMDKDGYDLFLEWQCA